VQRAAREPATPLAYRSSACVLRTPPRASCSHRRARACDRAHALCERRLGLSNVFFSQVKHA
jgi:hypothetical protein